MAVQGTPTVDVLISVASDHLDRFPEVVNQVVQAGLKVKRQLKITGVVTGSIEPRRVGALKRVPGVKAVETSRKYQLAPPEKTLQ